MDGDSILTQKPRRGRPPQKSRDFTDTRQALIRSGLEVLTESGYLSAGIEAVIKNIAVPKGSFYHCFKSKEAFGMAVLDAYGAFFAHKLDTFLLNMSLTPLQRLDAFVHHAGEGMAKYDFRRGCLVGNLLQETPLLPDAFPAQLKSILNDWECRVAACLAEAQDCGELPQQASSEALASLFWSGWEGAVMRAKLFRSAEPLDHFWAFFRQQIQITPAEPALRRNPPLMTRKTQL